MSPTRFGRWVAVALLASPAWLGAQYTDPPPSAAYAIQGATLVTPDATRAGVTLIVRRGTIEAIGADLEIPADAELLEGDSLYIYPGIVDAAGKADYKFPEVEIKREEIASWNPPRHAQSFTPHRRVADYLTATGSDLADQRKAGVVAAAVHPDGRLIAGQGATLIFRQDAETPETLVVNPSLGLEASLRGAERVYPATLFGVMAFYRQTFEDARHLAARQAAYSSGSNGLPAPGWDPDLSVMQAAMNGGTPVFFAVDLARDIQRVLRLSREYGFRPVIVGGEEAWKVADELKGVPVLVSLDFPKPERWKPDKKDKKKEEEDPGTRADGASQEEEEALDAGAEREKRRIENIYSNAGRLAAADVRFALTSGNGKAKIIENTRKAIEYGLSEEDALRALTTTPATLLGIERIARVERGGSATFIVSDAPLFSEDAKIVYTFVEGRLEKGDKKKADEGEDGEPTVDVTGTWDVTAETPDGTDTGTFTFTQSGASLEGEFSGGELGTIKIQNGKVSGNKITFSMVLDFGDESLELDLEGTVSEDEISGEWTGPDGTFTWTAKRVSGPEEEIER